MRNNSYSAEGTEEECEHDWKRQSDVITDRDGNRPIDTGGYECQKCGEMRAQLW